MSDAIRRLAATDYRYAAVLWDRDGDASFLPATGAWLRLPGAYPDQHEHYASAIEALETARRNPGAWILFGTDNPNEMRDPYPDCASDDDGIIAIA